MKMHMVGVLQWDLVLKVGSLQWNLLQIMILMVPEAWLPIYLAGNFTQMLLDLECT